MNQKDRAKQRPAPASEANAPKPTVDAVVDLLRSLIADLPPDDRRRLAATVLSDLRPTESKPARGKPVLNNIISLFQAVNRREWQASDVKKELAQRGQGAEPKAVYSALQYLARRGDLERVDYGRYRVRGYGIGIETSDDLGTQGDVD